MNLSFRSAKSTENLSQINKGLQDGSVSKGTCHLPAKPDNLSSLLRIHTVKEITYTHKWPSKAYMLGCTCAPPPTLNKQKIKNNKIVKDMWMWQHTTVIPALGRLRERMTDWRPAWTTQTLPQKKLKKKKILALGRQRQTDLCEFKVTLVYIVSSMLNRAIW